MTLTGALCGFTLMHQRTRLQRLRGHAEGWLAEKLSEKGDKDMGLEGGGAGKEKLVDKEVSSKLVKDEALEETKQELEETGEELGDSGSGAGTNLATGLSGQDFCQLREHFDKPGFVGHKLECYRESRFSLDAFWQ